jgi:two-component system cell cycle sensor histidine kinase PleC
MVEASASNSDKTSVNRERAERRRAVARTVRDQRERLTSSTGTRPAFDYELAATYARNRLGAAYTMPFLFVLVAVVALLYVEAPAVAAWAALTFTVHAFMLWIADRFLRDDDGPDNLKQWVPRFIFAELVYGLAWCTILALSWRAQGIGIDIFQFSTMLIVVAAGSMLASPLPSAALAGTLPIVLTLIGLFVERGGIPYYALAVIAAGAQGFFLMLSKRMYVATLAMLEIRAEKDLLIAELGTANAISDESRRRAEEANLAKSRFLATMSHELRTPLNAILGFSEVMRNEVLGPMENDTYKEYARDIHASGQHLLNLINEILDLSRIEAGRYELNEEPINIGHIVEECRHLMQLKARTKEIAVDVQVEKNMPRLWADERSVRQIVLNLLSNAVKFTQKGGSVTIKVGHTSGGGQYVSVKDNGPGIPEEEIPIVLSSFGQGSLAIKAAEQGTGLGLPIVQALVRMHEGVFELKSKLREGTEAIAFFPRSRVMEALPPVEDAERGPGRWRRAG